MFFFTTIIGVAVVFWLARMAFGRGHWGGPWRGMWRGGPWNNDANANPPNPNNGQVPPWVEEWHRKLHEQAAAPTAAQPKPVDDTLTVL